MLCGQLNAQTGKYKVLTQTKPNLTLRLRNLAQVHTLKQGREKERKDI